MGSMGSDEVNPYSPVPGSVPPVLTGRDPDLREIARSLRDTAGGKAYNVLVFSGERGMGKTVMLRTAEEMARERGGVVIDAQAMPGKTLREMFDHMDSFTKAQHDARAWHEKMGAAAKTAAKAARIGFEASGVEIASLGVDLRSESRSFIQELDALSAAVRKRGQFLVVTIDEIQSGDPAELRDLAAYLLHTNGPRGNPIAVVAAGLPETQPFLKNHVRTYTERWLHRSLGLLTQTATREAIERPAADRGVRYEDGALDLLVKTSGGYPHFVQQLGAEAWEERNGHAITLADAQRAIPYARDKMASIYEGRLSELSPRECAFAVALADLNADRAGARAIGDVAARMGTKSAQISSIRDRMEAKGVIRAPHSGYVEFRVPGMDGYIRDHREEFTERASPRFSPLLQIGQRIAVQHDGAGDRTVTVGAIRASRHERGGVGRDE
jgi:hypothetical protein